MTLFNIFMKPVKSVLQGEVGGGGVAYSNLETFRVGSKTSTEGLVDIPSV